MKAYKQIDFYGSILLILSSVLIATLWQDFEFVYCYYVVGGWQSISMVVHSVNGWFVQAGARRTYHFVVVAVLAGVAVGLVFESILLFMLYILLFAAPFMAVYYASICYHELSVKMQRPLAQLK